MLPQSNLQMPVALAAIATQDTDDELAARERASGAAAAREGKRRQDCPWKGGPCERWWLEGFDDPYAGIVWQAQ
jgi:hypothetical protein